MAQMLTPSSPFTTKKPEDEQPDTNTNTLTNSAPGGAGNSMLTSMITSNQGGGGQSNGIGDINSFYDNLSKEQDADWGKQQGMLQNQMNAFQRGAANLNARMGRSVAGGFATLGGAAMGKGMEQYNRASLAYNQLRQATGRDRFNALRTETTRQQDFNERQGVRNEQNAKDLLQMYLEYGDNLPPEQLAELERLFPGMKKPGAPDAPKPVELRFEYLGSGSRLHTPDGSVISMNTKEQLDLIDRVEKIHGTRLSPGAQKALVEEALRSRYFNGDGQAGDRTLLNFLFQTGWA